MALSFYDAKRLQTHPYTYIIATHQFVVRHRRESKARMFFVVDPVTEDVIKKVLAIQEE